MATIATEGGHFYLHDGTPFYTCKSKDGTERPATLRDARKVMAVPSVTEILKVAAKPQLTNWMIEQALDAVLTLPRLDGETDQAFKERARRDSQEQARKARDRGSDCHTSIERHIQGKPFDSMHGPHIAKLEANLAENFGITLRAGNSEHSFAHPLGFGGKADWHDATAVIDFKCKARLEDGKKLAWSEHAQQLHAYRQGFNIPKARMLNAFIGIDDCKVEIVEHDPNDETPWEMFCALLKFWQLSKGYQSGFEVQRAA